MGDELEHTADDLFAVPPRKLDKLSLLALWFQYWSHKKMVRSDYYTSIADALLMDREYKVQQKDMLNQAGRELEALVSAVEGTNGSAH